MPTPESIGGGASRLEQRQGRWANAQAPFRTPDSPLRPTSGGLERRFAQDDKIIGDKVDKVDGGPPLQQKICENL